MVKSREVKLICLEVHLAGCCPERSRWNDRKKLRDRAADCLAGRGTGISIYTWSSLRPRVTSSSGTTTCCQKLPNATRFSLIGAVRYMRCLPPVVCAAARYVAPRNMQVAWPPFSGPPSQWLAKVANIYPGILSNLQHTRFGFQPFGFVLTSSGYYSVALHDGKVFIADLRSLVLCPKYCTSLKEQRSRVV